MSLQQGTYLAKVESARLELLEAKDGRSWPVLSVGFKPIKFRNGPVWLDGEFTVAYKKYFLEDKIISKGKNAGRSSMEVVRQELQEVYGLQGGLDNIGSVIGVEAEVVVENNAAGYANVSWVNKPGGAPRGAGKSLSPEILAKLNASFLGKKIEVSSAPDPTAFFLRVQNGG